MIKNFIENIKNIDKFIFKIMINGIKISFVILLISILLLTLTMLNSISHLFYDAGLLLFKTGLTFGISFFICGFVFDKLKKQII